MDIRSISQRAGGVTKVAAACGIGHPSVSVWTAVPPRHVRTVASMAGLHPHDLRPDLYDPPAAPADAA
jgi:DNA-binding transcriptional regulator YdaS (Cro superfamily)